MFRYKYFYCKYRMVRYLNGELSDSVCRRIARYIDESDDCYKEYIRQRNLQHEMQVSVPVLGRASDEQLNRIWEAIKVGLDRRSHSRWGRFAVSYGIVVAILISLLMFPLLINRHEGVQVAPTQPAPMQHFSRAAATEPPNLVAINYEVTLGRIALTDSAQNAMMPMAAPGRTPNPSR